MDDEQHTHKAPSIARSDSSSASSVDQSIHASIPRPRLPSRKSSGTIIVDRDSGAVGPFEMILEPGDVRAMSPRRSGEDIEAFGRETRNELRK